MTTFLSLNNNRVVGYRIGPYEQSEKASNEVQISDVPLSIVNEYIFTLYNPEDKTFTRDDESERLLEEKRISESSGLSKADLFSKYIQDYMDSVAQQYKYDNIISAISYLNSSNPTFAKEAKAFSDWRDSVWEWYIDITEKNIPFNDVEIPPFVYPEELLQANTANTDVINTANTP